jgi:hypothetical protein
VFRHRSILLLHGRRLVALSGEVNQSAQQVVRQFEFKLLLKLLFSSEYEGIPLP